MRAVTVLTGVLCLLATALSPVAATAASAAPTQESTAGSPSSARGQTPTARFDVPAVPSSLLIAAAPDHAYSLRFRVAGEWSDWLDLSDDVTDHSGDDGPDAAVVGSEGAGAPPTRRALGPVRVPDAADAVDVAADPVPGAATGEVAVEGLVELTFLPNDSATDGGPQVAGAQQVALGDQPVIVPRSSWATEGWAADTGGCETGPIYADNVQAVIVHHTVTDNSYGRDEVDDLLRAIYHAHVVINGWCDIGYNFVVDRFGTIWEARSGGIDRPVIGGHAKGFNTGTVGIALLGQHQPGGRPSATAPSSAADTAVEALAAWKLSRYGVDPNGTTWLRNRSSTGVQKLESGAWHLVPTVLAHRDVGATSCPGSHGVTVVRSLPSRLAALHPGSVPYSYEAWRPASVGVGFVTADRGGGIRPAATGAVPGIGAPPVGDGALGGASAVAVAARPSPTSSSTPGIPVAEGYVVRADGELSPFGPAPAVDAVSVGSAPPVDLGLAASGGWVVLADGTVLGFGGQPDRVTVSLNAGERAVAAELDTEGNGLLLASAGRLLAVGGAGGPNASTAVSVSTGGSEAIDFAMRSTGGGWVLSADGKLHAFGGAPDAAITSSQTPPSGLGFQAVVARTNSDGGWVLTVDGRLWPFGGARVVLPNATSTLAADVVDVALLAPVVSDDYVESERARYLDAVVSLFLGRSAGVVDFERWDHEYSVGGRRGVTVGLARSDEWAGQRVDALYLDVLGRGADPDGRRYWVEQIAAGLSLESVGVYFYGSAEYVAESGSNEAYVDRLYRALLDRAADPDGRQYWAQLLTTGQASAPEVAAGFYASIESRRGRVTALYQQVLDRTPDEGGRDHWADQLLEIDDILLAAELAASDEFYERAISP